MKDYSDKVRTMLEQEYRKEWPLRMRIVRPNPHGLPVDKVFPFARRKEGNASPYPVEIKAMWPSVHDRRCYQMADSEVEAAE